MVCRLRPADRRRCSDASGGREDGIPHPRTGAPADSAWSPTLTVNRLGRVGAAHPATALRGALVLVQATPGPVLLRAGNSVIEAFKPDRAARADLLGLALPDVPLWLPLAVWPEEEH